MGVIFRTVFVIPSFPSHSCDTVTDYIRIFKTSPPRDDPGSHAATISVKQCWGYGSGPLHGPLWGIPLGGRCGLASNALVLGTERSWMQPTVFWYEVFSNIISTIYVIGCCCCCCCFGYGYGYYLLLRLLFTTTTKNDTTSMKFPHFLPIYLYLRRCLVPSLGHACVRILYMVS